MTLELALTWEDVQTAAKVGQTCIAPGMGNHDNAREDWYQYPGSVEYWINKERTVYARIIKVAQGWPSQCLWLLDYARPFDADHIQGLTQVLYGTLMVTYPPANLTEFRPTLLPALERPSGLKYMARSLHSAEWLLIPCKGTQMKSRELPTPVSTSPVDN